MEEVFGVDFPADYIDCTLLNHGGTPDPYVYDFETRKEAVFDRLLSYDPNQPHYILLDYDAIKDRLLDNVFPIASDPFGNYICFDYRQDEERSSIVFWDHEKPSRKTAISPICDTFTELLDKLYELEDDDDDLDW